jgi:hypothetical protein
MKTLYNGDIGDCDNIRLAALEVWSPTLKTTAYMHPLTWKGLCKWRDERGRYYITSPDQHEVFGVPVEFRADMEPGTIHAQTGNTTCRTYTREYMRRQT